MSKTEDLMEKDASIKQPSSSTVSNAFDVGADSLTIHGVPRILSCKSWVGKFFWLLLFLFCVTIYGYFVRDALRTHIKRDTVRQVTIESKSTMPFPSVTFCHRVPTDVTGTRLESRETVEEIYATAFHQTQPLDCMNEMNFDVFAVGYDNILRNSSTFCQFGFKKSCNLSFFQKTYDIPGCITFNPRGELRQANSGSDYGLKLLLYVNETFTDTSHDDATIFDGAVDKTVIVAVHKHDVFPPLWAQNVGLETGTYNKITITRNDHRLLKHPFQSNCADNVADVKLNVFPGKYNMMNCLTSCISFYSYDRCGDINPSYRHFLTYEKFPRRVTNVSDMQRCIQDYEETFYQNVSQFCDCPLPCQKTIYKTSLSTSRWPEEEQFDYVMKHIGPLFDDALSLSDIRKRFLLVSVYFDEMRFYKEEESEKYSFVNLMGDIGGQLGLYLGASVFSIVELCLIFFAAILSKFALCWKNIASAPIFTN